MSIPNAAEMLVNISQNIPSLIALASAIMYVLGMYIIITSVAGMRNAPVINSPGQGQTSMWTYLKHIFAGAALMYLPSTVDVAIATMFGSGMINAPYAYIDEGATNGFAELFNATFLVVELVGVIAVGKGVYELGYGQGSNSEKGHQGAFSKGLMHIIGGAMCINLHGTLLVIFNTLGITGILN